MIVDPPDGRLPALTEEAQQRLTAQGALRAKRPDSWLDRSLYDRCITRGVAGSALPVIYGNDSQIVQGPGWVAIRYEMVHEARLIPLDGRPHAPAAERSYMGDARGRWEGNTLVVETTNFLGNTTSMSVNGSTGPPASEELKLVERFTRVAPDAIQFSMTVSDPKPTPRRGQFPTRSRRSRDTSCLNTLAMKATTRCIIYSVPLAPRTIGI